jgi:hypothetical protein
MHDRSIRYCRSCLHSLRGLTSNRCPECGRHFDPDDPRTTLPRPYHEVWEWIARLGRALIRATVVLAMIALAVSVMGVDRPRAPALASCGLGIILLAVTFAISACPKVPLTRRLRIYGLVFPALFVSIQCTNWPIAATVFVCPPWADIIADGVQSTGPAARSPRTTAIAIRRGRVLHNGNVGFQLSGGDGGGIYLVRRAGPLSLGPQRVWYNTNWEKHLHGEWYLVFED